MSCGLGARQRESSEAEGGSGTVLTRPVPVDCQLGPKSREFPRSGLPQGGQLGASPFRAAKCGSFIREKIRFAS
jgi:hypothetical protein